MTFGFAIETLGESVREEKASSTVKESVSQKWVQSDFNHNKNKIEGKFNKHFKVAHTKSNNMKGFFGLSKKKVA